MIDSKLIDKIIAECDFENFTPDDSGEIHTPGLDEYIGKSMNLILENAADSFIDLMARKGEYEKQQIESKIEVSQGALFFSVVNAMYNYAVSSYARENVTHRCFTSLLKHIITSYQAFFTLALAGMLDASLSQIRGIYETYLILRYIMLHPELAEPFIDHAVIAQYRIVGGASQDTTDDELERHYRLILSKYGKDFREPYGWTATVIPAKNDRKLIHLVRELGMEDYRFVYILSSEIIHPSSFAVNRELDDSVFLRPFSALAVELVTNAIIFYLGEIGADEKARVLLMNILYGFREEIFGEPKGTGHGTPS